MYKFCFWFLLYFIYCVLGYLLECMYCSIIENRIVYNRGFLIGPYLSIYGTGAMCILFLLRKYVDDFIALFVMASLISTILEYFASFVMEKIFKARWWDYSDERFNINGRVCLKNSILFGVASFFVVYLINPFIINVLFKFNKNLLIVLAIVFFVIYLMDIVVSVLTIYKLRTNSISINKDLTEEISEQVRSLLMKNRYFYRRLLDAFPSTGKIKKYDKLKEVLNKKR